MNNANIAIVRNRNSHSHHHKSEDYIVLDLLLCVLSSVIMACNIEMAQNNEGIVISLTRFPFLVMFIANLLLWVGLRKNNAALIIPWVCVSIWGLYYIQWSHMGKLFKLMYYKTPLELAWMKLLAYFIGLLIKVHMITCVVHIAIQEWDHNQLNSDDPEDE